LTWIINLLVSFLLHF